jgi:hypothetical protein
MQDALTRTVEQCSGCDFFRYHPHLSLCGRDNEVTVEHHGHSLPSACPLRRGPVTVGLAGSRSTPAPVETWEDRSEPPPGYEVSEWACKHAGYFWEPRVDWSPGDRHDREEAVALCWAHFDSLTAPAEARAREAADNFARVSAALTHERSQHAEAIKAARQAGREERQDEVARVVTALWAEGHITGEAADNIRRALGPAPAPKSPPEHPIAAIARQARENPEDAAAFVQRKLHPEAAATGGTPEPFDVLHDAAVAYAEVFEAWDALDAPTEAEDEALASAGLRLRAAAEHVVRRPAPEPPAASTEPARVPSTGAPRSQAYDLNRRSRALWSESAAVAAAPSSWDGPETTPEEWAAAEDRPRAPAATTEPAPRTVSPWTVMPCDECGCDHQASRSEPRTRCRSTARSRPPTLPNTKRPSPT